MFFQLNIESETIGVGKGEEGGGERLVLLLYIAFNFFLFFDGLVPSPYYFNSLPALHAHATGLKFTWKRTRGPLEKKIFI